MRIDYQKRLVPVIRYLEQNFNEPLNLPEVVNIALKYGFSSSQSLAKAFQQHYGVTPTDFRNCANHQQFAELTRSSKIGHVLRKTGNDIKTVSTYTDSESITWSITVLIFVLTAHTAKDMKKPAVVCINGLVLKA